MIKAKDIMTTDVITVRPDTEINQAARLLVENQINGVPVVNDAGDVLGILCQSDLIAQQKQLPIPSVFSFLDGFFPLTSIKQMEKQVRKITALTVSEAMSPHPVTVDPDTCIEAIAALMVDRNFHTLPVVRDGRLMGIVGKKDVLCTLVPCNEPGPDRPQ